jgi:hypothetical protein
MAKAHFVAAVDGGTTVGVRSSRNRYGPRRTVAHLFRLLDLARWSSQLYANDWIRAPLAWKPNGIGTTSRCRISLSRAKRDGSANISGAGHLHLPDS